MPITNKETETTKPNVEDTKVDETIETSDENTNNKNNFLRKILIYVIAFLISVLVIISIFYIFDFFVSKDEDKGTQVVVETPEKTPEQVQTQQYEEPKHEESNFDFSNLDPDKLNEQLALLTNKNIEQSRLEELKAKNEKKLIEEKKINEPIIKANEIEASKEANKELNSKTEDETLKNNSVKKQNTTTKTNTEEPIKEQQNPNKEENTNSSIQQTTTNNNSFIKLINVAKIKGALKKKFLDKVIAVNPNVHLCRDEENIIELYFGPFDDDETRKELYNKLVSKGFKEAYELEMTQEEFDKSCNY